jgi:hypothetical protein
MTCDWDCISRQTPFSLLLSGRAVATDVSTLTGTAIPAGVRVNV